MRILLSVALLFALVSLAAADDDKVKEAKMHYENAEKAMQEGRYEGAAAEYIVAYEIMGDAVLFYKIGNAYDKGGNCEQALVYYRRYLRQGAPSETQKTLTEERIANCGKTDAGTDAGTGDTGSGTGTGTGTDTGTGTETGTETGTGTGIADPEPVPGTDPSFLDEKPSLGKSVGWVLMGTTVVLATAGTILALSGQSREEDIQALADYRDAQGFPTPYQGTVSERYEDLVDEGDRFNTYAKVAFIGAGVTAVASVTLLILSRDSGESDSGSAISRKLRRVTPVLGGGHAGLAASFDF